MNEVKEILSVAKGLKMNVTGLAFHVGSLCKDANSYANSIKDAREVFNIAKELGFKFVTINLGGGYPGIDTDEISFKDIALVINNAITDYFSDIQNLNVIAEPGRFFVASSHTLILNVMNKKVRIDNETGEKNITYYVDDGVYNSLNNLIMDHFVVNETNLFPFNERHEKKYKCVIYGPTCDSGDIITNNIMLPDLTVGETLLINGCGAYVRMWTPHSTEIAGFNGFTYTEPKYVLN